MRLKTYYADSVQAAVRIAKIELGDQAVLLGSKQAESEGDSRYEVTFGTAESAPEPEDAPTGRPHWKRFVPREVADQTESPEPPVEAVEAVEAAEGNEVLAGDLEWQKLKSGIDDLCRIIRADAPTADRQTVLSNGVIDSPPVPRHESQPEPAPDLPSTHSG